MKEILKIKNENKRFVNKITEKRNKKVSASKDLETAEKSVRAIDDQCIKVIVLHKKIDKNFVAYFLITRPKN